MIVLKYDATCYRCQGIMPAGSSYIRYMNQVSGIFQPIHINCDPSTWASAYDKLTTENESAQNICWMIYKIVHGSEDVTIEDIVGEWEEWQNLAHIKEQVQALESQI